jgi:hypothetical protein
MEFRTDKVMSWLFRVATIVLVLLWYGFRQWSHAQAQKTMDEIVMWNEISAPNIHISNQTYDSDWFGGEIDTQTFKLIGNRPYIWEPIERKYNLFGYSSRKYGSFGAIQLDGSESLVESSQLYQFNSYTGDREMFFYHPEISYDAYTGEYLDYMKRGQSTIHADSFNIYGFHSEQFAPYGGMDSFITSIEQLRKSSKSFKWEAEQVYKSLAGENKTLEKNDQNYWCRCNGDILTIKSFTGATLHLSLNVWSDI